MTIRELIEALKAAETASGPDCPVELSVLKGDGWTDSFALFLSMGRVCLQDTA